MNKRLGCAQLAETTMADVKKRPKQDKKTNDPRFAAVAKDPRFHKFPQAQKKVQIDSRFAGRFALTATVKIEEGLMPLALTDLGLTQLAMHIHFETAHAWVPTWRADAIAGMFSDPAFQTAARVDKRGKKVWSAHMLSCPQDKRLATTCVLHAQVHHVCL